LPNFSIEHKFDAPVIGLDEVGRGALAGPVISCGCVFHDYTIQNEFSEYILDSKKLSRKKRLKSFKYLNSLKNKNQISYCLGIAKVDEIDSINILEATKLSMKRAINKFNLNNAILIIDGNFQLKHNNFFEKSIIKGDQISLSIAASSIIAKIHRDRLMKILSYQYPHYDWENNSGYGTKTHIEEIKNNNYSKYHRKSFEPLKSILS